MLAEAYDSTGQPESGLKIVAKALTQVETTGEHFVEAELHRLRGELQLRRDGACQRVEWTPEACFQKVLDVARSQQAKSWELRAATSLARLW